MRSDGELIGLHGLTIVPSFPQLPGENTRVLADGRGIGSDHPWMSDQDPASFAYISDEFGAEWLRE